MLGEDEGSRAAGRGRGRGGSGGLFCIEGVWERGRKGDGEREKESERFKEKARLVDVFCSLSSSIDAPLRETVVVSFGRKSS